MSTNTMTPDQVARLAQINQMAGMPNPVGLNPSAAQSAPMPQLGGNNVQLPGGTASPAVPHVPMTGTPPGQSNVSARGLFPSIIGGVIAIKQKKHNDSMQKARAFANQYIALAQRDPKQAQSFLETNKDAHKLFDKAVKDPNSAEAQGIQLAYRDQMGREQADLQMQQMKAQVQETQNRSQAEAARAGAEEARRQAQEAQKAYVEKQTAQAGTVTAADQFKAKTQEEIAKIHAKTIADQIMARSRDANHRAQLMYDAAMARVKMMKSALGQHTGDKTLDSMAKEYQNLATQIGNIQKSYGKFQDDIKAHPILDWLNTKHFQDVRAQMTALDGQRSVLEKQLQMIEQKRQLMLKVGALPADAGNIGSESEPIVVNSDDLGTAQ